MKKNEKELVVICNCRELAPRVYKTLCLASKRVLKSFKQISPMSFRLTTFERTQLELSTILVELCNRRTERIKFELTE